MQDKQHRPGIFGIQLPHVKRTGSSSPNPATEEQASPNPPPKPWRKRLPRRLPYWLAGLGVAGLVIFALCPTPVTVDLGQVEQGSLRVTVDAEGKTRVRDRFIIAAPVSGRLARIDLESGDSVQEGTVIARIDSLPFNAEVQAAQARLRELRAQLAGVETQRTKPAALAEAEANISAAVAAQRQAEANYQEAQANLTQAIRDRDRARELQASGAISRQDRENAELTATRRQQEVEAARRQVDAAIANVAAVRNARSVLQAEQQDPDYLLEVYRAQIASVEASLANLADAAQRTTVSAPAAGRVLRIMQKSARFVQAGDPLLELGNARQLELVIDVLSTDAVNIKPGALIQIDHWGGDEPLQAKVRSVEPAAFTEVSALGVEEQRVNVIADFVNLPQSLGDGYRVEAQIVTWEGKDVVKVPTSALFRCNQQAWCTFVDQNGKAQQRQIVISHRNDLEAVVEQGLTAGERVILHPSEEITDGQSIRDRS